jgi:hypothetical protein
MIRWRYPSTYEYEKLAIDGARLATAWEMCVAGTRPVRSSRFGARAYSVEAESSAHDVCEHKGRGSWSFVECNERAPVRHQIRVMHRRCR